MTKEQVVLKIASHPRYLSIVRAVAVLAAEHCGLHYQAVEDVKHAIDEACSNVIKYAYRGDPDRQIVLCFMGSPESFEVTIEDDGIKTRPENLKERSLDEVKVGGLGLHIIRKAFDTVKYDESKEDGNRLVLVRNMIEEE
ncbi:MAG: ATP-binding protein [Nitrospirae bacterium]|nr:ATP-binding protein [Nitrospirota bacterium]